MIYAIGADGFVNLKYGKFENKEEAMKELETIAENERKLHEIRPDWTWVNYHLMQSEHGNNWSIAKMR